MDIRQDKLDILNLAMTVQEYTPYYVISRNYGDVLTVEVKDTDSKSLIHIYINPDYGYDIVKEKNKLTDILRSNI